MFLLSHLGSCRQYLIYFFSFCTGRRCRCSQEQACGFPVFSFSGLFLALRRCQGAPLLGASRVFFILFFPESGAPTGGSSPGQLQMRNSWPAALAVAQIRPFEKITVLLLLPPPPVGHAGSAEGRGMCRRAESRRGWGGGGSESYFIRPLSESFL